MGLAASAGATPSTENTIDLGAIAPGTVTSVSLNTGTDILIVNTTGGNFTLQLNGTYTGDVAVATSDGASGTDLFLAPAGTVFVAQGANDSWLDPTSWGGSVPSTTPAAGTSFAFFNHDNGSDDIVMPASLRQATGSGTSTWTISDTSAGANQFTSDLTLKNLGQIYVNGTNSFAQANATTNWTVTGAAAGAGVGLQIFENDGSIDVIGTLGVGGGSTTANFTGNVELTGDGSINLYGNGVLNLANSGGTSAGQTINFESDGTAAVGAVTEGARAPSTPISRTPRSPASSPATR